MSVEPRIKPIEKPKGILNNFLYWYMKKEFGKVIMPAKVIYSRYPKIAMLIKKLYDTEESMKLIDTPTKFLIQNFVATLNGCSFCMDISKKRTINKKIGLDKFNNLMIYMESPMYDEKEKAILNYVKEMTENIVVEDKTFARLRSFFTDEHIIEITYISATENYLNRLIKPLNIGSDQLCEIR